MMVSFIIPVFNAGLYLRECLDSLFAQTFQGFSVFCIDDGSVDCSPEILNEYSFAHQNMSVIRTDNYGPSHARNIALDIVLSKDTGFIMFLDADDALEPDYLQRMIDAQASSGVDIVCSSFLFYKDGHKKAFRLMAGEPRLLSGFEATKELLADKTIQSHSHCKLYKSFLWEGVRFPEHIVAMEDQGTVFKTFYKANSVLIDPSIMGYLYRQTANSICSSKITNKRVLDSIEGYMIPCQFGYPGCDVKEKQSFLSIAIQSLGACYLMMYPRFDKRHATNEEEWRWMRVKKFIESLHVVWLYKPDSKRERTKRFFYLILRPLYRWIYLRFSH